ncbi:hypothetical protein UCRPA7_1713 [Phaeoacremonium minimum UCRPA7]|uniref:Uncharacterized protein n=1 Tax=Phaeoacremonium minimum (strain UCR-PA7) TaxID=1286976 RepID=R8BTX7_PHAM7|nr:hypothetical protein UCRPA7_1713 [Phaeoacremonium minimum UCRPA7]EOO02740.1 hypothetical protein UCRPA7_1713 [Phaeoacremonium minimum UCRPA7]
MDPELRSQINAVLLRDGHVLKIQEHLLHSLHAHPNNWPTMVQNHALNLLRSGEVTTFPALLRRVMDDVRQETSASSSSSSSATNSTSTPTKNGAEVNGKKVNGASSGPGPGEAQNLNKDTTSTLAVPAAVIEEALKVTRDALEMEEDDPGGYDLMDIDTEEE